MKLKLITFLLLFSGFISAQEIKHFKNGQLNLAGELFKPNGKGPFPTILYNHGSAPGMLSSEASKTIAPLFLQKGWAFFMPYRRGQGLSAKAGKYIGDEPDIVRALKTDHFSDQMAGLTWLKKQKFINQNKIAVMGNSFGGIQTILATSQNKFCAGVDAAGGSESWAKSKELQDIMKEAVAKSQTPLFFFQAENDFDLSPSKILSGIKGEMKIYPAFGKTAKDGHSFTYRGSSIWFEDVFSFILKNCGQ
ncbi:MAG: alpha/beta hydrolase family protein [Bacteriovoracaceae bacterium]